MNNIEEIELRSKIANLLNKEVAIFILKGKGACNNAYYVETEDGGRYIVKQERVDKETYEQNNLIVEAQLIKKLNNSSIFTHIPEVIFISENLNMYGYKYIDGDMMKDVWVKFSENDKISLCKEIGYFHAEIGKVFNKEMAIESHLKIDESTEVHPEVVEQYNRLSVDETLPIDFRVLVQKARKIFNTTNTNTIFQFIHNDPHHENILIKDKKISGVIDFGDAEFGDVTKEFSRYIRDYPDYFEYIVSAYEEKSGNKLSRERLICNALICGFSEIVESYEKGGEEKDKAEKAILVYKKFIDPMKV